MLRPGVSNGGVGERGIGSIARISSGSKAGRGSLLLSLGKI